MIVSMTIDGKEYYDASSIVEEAANTIIADLKAERDRLQKIVNDVDDVLVVCHLCAKNDDYKKALAEMVAWEISVHEYFEIEKLTRERDRLARELELRVVSHYPPVENSIGEWVADGYSICELCRARTTSGNVTHNAGCLLAQPAAQVQAAEKDKENV